jgi:hypothetical protein
MMRTQRLYTNTRLLAERNERVMKSISSTLERPLFPDDIDSDEKVESALAADQLVQKKNKDEVAENNNDGKTVEFLALGTWIAALSSFLLINNYVGPWPQALTSVPVQYYGLAHALSAMLFGGGIVLTTMIEWLVVSSKKPSVLNFWFAKVPDLDSKIVLPGLTGSIVSGVGLTVDHYDTLGDAPPHVVAAISALLAFAGWWAVTDLTTQGAATEAIKEWTEGDTENTDVPRILQLRRVSNVVSCMFVTAIYAIMVLKPGYSP